MPDFAALLVTTGMITGLELGVVCCDRFWGGGIDKSPRPSGDTESEDQPCGSEDELVLFVV